MIDFSNVARLHIPEGEVKRVLNESGIVIWEKGAPSYVELEYMEVDGTICFDTGVYGNIDTKIECKWKRDIESGTYVYGCASSENKASLTAYVSATGGAWRFGTRSATPLPKGDLDIHTTVQNHERVVRDGSIFNYAEVSDFTTPYTIIVAGSHTSSGAYSPSPLIGRIYYFKMWDGDNLVLDWIPVKKDNTLMFLDRVSNKFIRPIIP